VLVVLRDQGAMVEEEVVVVGVMVEEVVVVVMFVSKDQQRTAQRPVPPLTQYTNEKII